MSDKIDFPNGDWMSEALISISLQRSQTSGVEGGDLNLLEVPPSKLFKHVRVWTYLFHCYLWLTADGKSGAGNARPMMALQTCLDANEEMLQLESALDLATKSKVFSERRRIYELSARFDFKSAELEQSCRKAIEDGFPGLKSAESVMLLWAVSRRPYIEGQQGNTLHSDLLCNLDGLSFGSSQSSLEDARRRIMLLKTQFDQFEYPDYAFVDLEHKIWQDEMGEYHSMPEGSDPFFNSDGQPWSWITPSDITKREADRLSDDLIHLAVMLKLVNQIHPVIARQYLRLCWKKIDERQKNLRITIAKLYHLENDEDASLSVNDKRYCKVWVLRKLYELSYPEALETISINYDEMRPSSFRSSSRRFFEDTALAELERRANFPGGMYHLGLYMRQASLMKHLPDLNQLKASGLNLDA